MQAGEYQATAGGPYSSRYPCGGKLGSRELSEQSLGCNTNRMLGPVGFPGPPAVLILFLHMVSFPVKFAGKHLKARALEVKSSFQTCVVFCRSPPSLLICDAG